MFNDLLKDSDNIVLVNNCLDFLLNLIYSHSSPKKSKFLKYELIETNIYDLFDIINLRLDTDKYKIESCTYDFITNRL